jgi:hypothetical protein
MGFKTEFGLALLASCCKAYSSHSSTLKMEVLRTSKTYADIQRTTWHYIYQGIVFFEENTHLFLFLIMHTQYNKCMIWCLNIFVFS